MRKSTVGAGLAKSLTALTLSLASKPARTEVSQMTNDQ